MVAKAKDIKIFKDPMEMINMYKKFYLISKS